MEWLTGDGPRERSFKDGDHFAELLRKHDHIKREIKKAGEEAARRCASSCDSSNFIIPERQGSYRLDGVQGVWKYIKDYSTLLTAGNTGNLAVTFLGSYRMKLEVSEISCCNGKAHVKALINNESTAASGFRPPVIGYTQWWQQHVAPIINNWFSHGMGSPTKQNVELNEDVKFNKSNCPK